MGVSSELIKDVKDIKKALIALAAIEYVKMTNGRAKFEDAIGYIKKLMEDI